MSSRESAGRCRLILEKVRAGKHPSFTELKKYLREHDFEISDRTLQRDIKQAISAFGVEIKYDRYQNGYFLDEESNVDPNQFLRLIEIVRTADLLTQSLREGKEALRYLSFDAEGSLLHGIEHLKPILYAVKNRRKIAFTHYNYTTEETKQFLISPYLLKEYQNRWYVVGTIDAGQGIEQFRTFGIDRIKNLEMKAEVFKPVKAPNPLTFFENIIGLMYSDEKPQEVILSFNPLQGKYIKSLPLHKSQKVLQDDDTGVRVSLCVIPNFELKQKILMHGGLVKVLGPEKLAVEIQEALRTALRQYS